MKRSNDLWYISFIDVCIFGSQFALDQSSWLEFRSKVAFYDMYHWYWPFLRLMEWKCKMVSFFDPYIENIQESLPFKTRSQVFSLIECCSINVVHFQNILFKNNEFSKNKYVKIDLLSVWKSFHLSISCSSIFYPSSTCLDFSFSPVKLWNKFQSFRSSSNLIFIFMSIKFTLGNQFTQLEYLGI